MNKEVLKYLREKCPTEPYYVDRVIVSSFLAVQGLEVKENRLLKKYIISKDNIEEYELVEGLITLLDKTNSSLDFEQLISLFEFVISPADRVITGAVYTPSHIRNYIVDNSFKIQSLSLQDITIADICCGCGGFLFDVSKKLKNSTNKDYAYIFSHQIYGLDIQEYSVERTKILLSLLAISEGEDIKAFSFNIFTGNTLEFKWNEYIDTFKGFDIIVGNPPYVCSRNIEDSIKKSVMSWSVSSSGHPDLYIPFFQVGIESLSKNGVLSYITMNSFFKSLNGRKLREYFQQNLFRFKIIDFGAEQIFKSRNTYTCICFIEKKQSKHIEYTRIKEQELNSFHKADKVSYSTLDSFKGWNLYNNRVISKLESIGQPLGEKYKTRHGLATLKNNIYIFKPVGEDEDFFYLQNGRLFKIEKGICKDVVNSNKVNEKTSIENLKEKIIFPYSDDKKPSLLDEKFFRDSYPNAYNYLVEKRTILANRDKGKGKYENWFAFGRTQSLERVKNKLFFPKMINRQPSCILSSEENLFFYNGQAIIGHSEEEMILIKKIIESRLFWFYIKSTSKPYTSNYYSMNGNYINNFGIYDFTTTEKEFLINEDNKDNIDRFLEEKYSIKIDTVSENV